MRWLLLLSLLCVALCVDESEFQFDKGILFVDRGKILASPEMWRVKIPVNITVFSEAVDDLKGHVENFYSEFGGAGMVNRNSSLFGWMLHQQRSQQTGVQRVDTMLREIHDSIDNFSQRHRRKKRFTPFKFVGKGLQWLFGTATVEDIEELELKLANVTENMGQLQSIADTHAYLYNFTHNLIDSNKDRLEAQVQMLNNLSDDMKKVDRNTHQLLGSYDALSWNLTSTSRAVLSVNALQAALELLESQVSSLKQAYLFASVGKLDPFFLPRDTAAEIVRQVESSGSRLDVNNIYSLSEVSAFEDASRPGVLLLLLTFPAPHANNLFTLYQPLPLPAPLQQGLFFQVQPEAELIAVDDNRTKYFHLTHFEFNACRSSSIKVCQPHDVTRLESLSPSCLVRLLRDEVATADQLCSVVVMRSFRPRIFRPTPTSGYVYSVASKIPLDSNCRHPDLAKDIPESLSGAGVLHVPRGCSVHSMGFELYGSEQPRTLQLPAADMMRAVRVSLPEERLPVLRTLEGRLGGFDEAKLDAIFESEDDDGAYLQYEIETLASRIDDFEATASTLPLLDWLKRWWLHLAAAIGLTLLLSVSACVCCCKSSA